MGAAILLSSVIDQILPRVYPPLIQIALGIVISLLVASPNGIDLDPDFFLLLFVAPILFNDAREADKVGLWRNRSKILALAVGLVIAITLVVGFTIHAIVPSIPLAAAFALGAALGPTDAVAVTSLKSVVRLSRKENSLLSGEALINDASGVVAFEFSVAAAVTGTFSIAEASTAFLVEFFGGIVVGILLALLFHWLSNKMHEIGLDSSTFHVLLDLLLPFMIYLIAVTVHTSGILAVVAAGLLLSGLGPQVISPTSARLGIVSSSVWQIMVFVLNGVVFVILGMVLPMAFRYEWMNVSIENHMLIFYVLVTTVAIVGVRFIWTYAMELIGNRKSTGKGALSRKAQLKSVLTTTIGGPKGAVTLSIIMSLPFLTGDGTAFPDRSLIIFIASGTILLTLLLANFLMPVLSPAPEEGEAEGLPESGDEIAEIKISILQQVMSRLVEEQNDGNERATVSVIRALAMRIENIRAESDIDSVSSVTLRLEVLERQRNELFRLYYTHQAGDIELFNGMLRIARQQSLLTHRYSYWWMVTASLRHLPSTVKGIANLIANWFRMASDKPIRRGDPNVARLIEEDSIAFLQGLVDRNDPLYPASTVQEQIDAHQAIITALDAAMANGGLTTAFPRVDSSALELERHAYHLELDEIDNAQERGDVSRATARALRDNVYLMLVDLEENV